MSKLCCMFHILSYVVPVHCIHPHSFKPHFNVAFLLQTAECHRANGNKQLTDSLMDPHPVSLLVVCITEEQQKIGRWQFLLLFIYFN